MSTFTDKVALVTGGASGLGRALSRALAAEGAIVVLSDIDETGARAVASDLVAAGHRAEAGVLDVRDADAVRAWIEGARTAHGRLDYLFNNAGLGMFGETLEQSLDDWRRLADVNLHGVLHGVLAAYPLMVAQGHGHIVNVSSVAGLVPSPHLAAYAMTKHAVLGLSTSLREEARELGVRVSCACPGFIDTSMMQTATFTNIDRDRALADARPFLVTAERCAAEILRGVRRDRAVIVATRHGRWIHRLYRHAPWLMRWGSRFNAARVRRRCRTEPLHIPGR